MANFGNSRAKGSEQKKDKGKNGIKYDHWLKLIEGELDTLKKQMKYFVHNCLVGKAIPQ